MDTWPPVAAAAAMFVAGAAYLLLDVLLTGAGDAAVESAKEAAFRRPSSGRTAPALSGADEERLSQRRAVVWCCSVLDGRRNQRTQRQRG